MSSIRKHISQMAKQEIDFLWKELYSVGAESWKVTPHLMDRIDERGGSFEDILSIIYNGTIIEYHLRSGKSRILIRGKKAFGDSVICAVFEPKTMNVITLYWNNSRDNHSTIDMTPYIADLDVLDSWQTSA